MKVFVGRRGSVPPGMNKTVAITRVIRREKIKAVSNERRRAEIVMLCGGIETLLVDNRAVYARKPFASKALLPNHKPRREAGVVILVDWVGKPNSVVDDHLSGPLVTKGLERRFPRLLLGH